MLSLSAIRTLRRAAERFMFERVTIYEQVDRTRAARTAEDDIDDTFPDTWTDMGNYRMRVLLPSLRTMMSMPSAVETVSFPTGYFEADAPLTSTSRCLITASKLTGDRLIGAVFDVEFSPVGSFLVQRKADLYFREADRLSLITINSNGDYITTADGSPIVWQ